VERPRSPLRCLQAATWHAPIARAQYAETRAADCAARYVSRAIRANEPPQQQHRALGIALGN
jgi:hypothetical protein